MNLFEDWDATEKRTQQQQLQQQQPQSHHSGNLKQQQQQQPHQKRRGVQQQQQGRTHQQQQQQQPQLLSPTSRDGSNPTQRREQRGGGGGGGRGLLGTVWGQGQAAPPPQSSLQVAAESAPVSPLPAELAVSGGGYGGSSTTNPFAGGGASLNPFAPPSSNPFGGGPGGSSNPFGSTVTGADGSSNVRPPVYYCCSALPSNVGLFPYVTYVPTSPCSCETHLRAEPSRAETARADAAAMSRSCCGTLIINCPAVDVGV